MKTRNGFVSNSSSSSFILDTHDTEKIINVLNKLKDKNIQFTVSLFCGQYGDTDDNLQCQKLLSEEGIEFDLDGDGNVYLDDSDSIESLLEEIEENDDPDWIVSEDSIQFLKTKLEEMKKNEN